MLRSQFEHDTGVTVLDGVSTMENRRRGHRSLNIGVERRDYSSNSRPTRRGVTRQVRDDRGGRLPSHPMNPETRTVPLKCPIIKTRRKNLCPCFPPNVSLRVSGIRPPLNWARTNQQHCKVFRVHQMTRQFQSTCIRYCVDTGRYDTD